MTIKKYKVITKDGKSHPTLFDTVSEAIKTVGAGKILKVEERSIKEEVSESSIDKKNVIVIARTNKELQISNTTNHAATLNRPVLTKVFDGMTVLELGEDKVLESKVNTIGTFEKNRHKDWDDGKDYQWVLYHYKGNILTLEEAFAKYKDLDKFPTKEGAITYFNKGKI